MKTRGKSLSIGSVYFQVNLRISSSSSSVGAGLAWGELAPSQCLLSNLLGIHLLKSLSTFTSFLHRILSMLDTFLDTSLFDAIMIPFKSHLQVVCCWEDSL